MNEVGSTTTVAPRGSVPASSKGIGSSAGPAEPSGKSLPPVTEAMNRVTQNAAESAKQLDNAVAQMNEYIQSEQRDLQFSVDEVSGQTIVRVTDRETGDLIRQIPNEVFLTLAEQARKNEAIHLISANG